MARKRHDDWRSRLLRWIKRLFGYKQEPIHRLEKSWTTRLGTLHRLRRNVPGAVATYRFIPSYKSYDLLLTCDTAEWAEIKASRIRRPDNAVSTEPPWGVALANRSHPTPTHLVALLEVARMPSSRAKTVRVLVRWAYFTDFVGIRVYAAPDSYAKLITAELAQHLLLRHDDEIHWQRLIHDIAAKYVQANHTLTND